MTRVLLLADDASIARAAAVHLREEEACEVDFTSSVTDAIERLSKECFDFVVVDRVADCFAVALKIESWLQAEPNQTTLLVPSSTAFRVESVLASALQHERDLEAVVENAIQFRLSAKPAGG